MGQELRLYLWGPGGEAHQVHVPNATAILPTLKAWAAEIGCRPGDIDYQINDGVRVLGEAGAKRRYIDVCGLPRKT